MRPVDDATLRSPLVLAVELDWVAGFHSCNALREVDVVCHEQRLPGCQANDESLVATAAIVVRKDSGDVTTAFDLYVTAAILERRGQHLVATVRANGSVLLPPWNKPAFYARNRLPPEQCR